MKNKPFPKRGSLMTWLLLPFDLWRIRRESPADAAELIRYIESRRSPRMKTRPMQLILTELRKRVPA